MIAKIILLTIISIPIYKKGNPRNFTIIKSIQKRVGSLKFFLVNKGCIKLIKEQL